MGRGTAAAGIYISAAIVACASATPAFAATKLVDFQIEPQPLQTALNLFSRQSGIQLLFPYEQVSGRTARAIRGRMAPQAALSQLIAGSGLTIRYRSNGVIALSVAGSRAASPGRGAEMVGTRTSIGFVPSAPPQTEPRPGAAVEVTPTPEAETVVVTGSRGLQRTVADSPTPIDVIKAEDLERIGKAGVLSALNILVPSFHVPARSGGATSTIISTGGLRGLNPDQTLILVNGKRRHKTSLINAVGWLYNGSVPADLDMISTAAIDHIEVLRDGAAAQYGSDAIAGVINIILRRNEGVTAMLSAGQNFDRSDGELYRAELNVGTKLGDAGFLNLSVSAKDQNLSNRATPISSGIRLYPLVNGRPDPREAGFDRLVSKSYGLMPQQSINTAYNFAYDAGPVELYSQGTYSQRQSDLFYFFRSPADLNNVIAIYPDGFTPHVTVDEDDLEFAVGLKGIVRGWRWDLSTSYGRNRARMTSVDTLNPTLGILSPKSFYIGTLNSSEHVTSLDLTRSYSVGGGNLQVSLGAQHRLESYSTEAGDPASYAVGPITAVGGRALTPGAQSSQGFQPQDAREEKRNNLAAYADLVWDPTSQFTLAGAARFEHYDDGSGDTLIWKLSGRYAPTPWLGIRGAVNTGFRAPSVAQLIYSQTTNQFRVPPGASDLALFTIKTLPVDSAAAIALGARPLQPETSLSFSGGLVLTPARGLNLTVDAYQVAVDDRIAITSTLSGAQVSAILVQNGLSPTLAAQYYTNGIDTRTRGIDVVATYRHGVTSNVKMSWGVGYNYNETVITNIIPNPPQLATISFDLFDRFSRSNLTENLPKTKLLFSNLTEIGPFSLNSRLVRYGEYSFLQNSTGVGAGGQPLYANDRTYGAKWITDLELSWKATKSLEVAIGANNLFNVYPDAVGVPFPTLGQGQYGATPAYGFTGGFYYARLGLKL